MLNLPRHRNAAMYNDLQRSPMAQHTSPLVPLHLETRTALPTPEAAAHLNRAQYTMRRWACYEEGPIRPVRVNGRLAWPVAEIKRVLGLTCEA